MLPSEKLREAIKGCGRSLGSLARESGSDTGNLSKFVTGKAGMKLDLGVRLAVILGVEFSGEGDQMILEGRPLVDVLEIDDPSPEETTPEQRRSVEVVAQGKPKPVQVTPRISTPSPSSIPGGPKRADDKRELTVPEKRLRKKLGFGDGG